MTATWEELDGIILQYVADHEDDRHLHGDSVQVALGLDKRPMENAVGRLVDAGLLTAQRSGGLRGEVFMDLRTTGSGRERLGLWPTPEILGRAFLAELERIAEDESADPVERSRAKELASKVAHWGAEALVGTAIGALPGIVLG